MDVKEQLKDIKTQLRLSMNGVVSQSMREKGLDYKLNFGVELPRIKALLPLTRRVMIWHKPCGKRISVNVRFWQAYYSR